MIKKLFLLFCLIWSSVGFKYLNNVNRIRPKIIKPCDTIHPILLETVYEISEKIDGFEIGDCEYTGIICNQPNGHYGYTTIHNSGNTTNIYIKDELINKPNTLYNVVLHEVLHSLGLDHTYTEGMMNYTVSLDWFGNIKNDDRKLWMSIDDYNGIQK